MKIQKIGGFRLAKKFCTKYKMSNRKTGEEEILIKEL